MAHLPKLIDRAVPRRFRGYHPRVYMVLAAFMAVLMVLTGRAYYLQVVQHEELTRLAHKQSQRTVRQKGRRGEITDRFGGRLAFSLRSDSFFAHPATIKEQSSTAFRLSRMLGLDARELEQKLRTDRGFVWIKRQVSPKEAAEVKRLELEGIGSVEEYRRVYPWGEFGAALLGFTGIDSQGLEGLEYAYDSVLQGDEVIRVLDRDALGRVVLSGGERQLSSGGRIVLTIHPALQYIAERELARAVRDSEAAFGVALAMKSDNGEILAMAHYPSFNPNDYPAYDKETYFNRAITSGYEPGSTMKVLTTAVALEEKVVNADTLLYCEDGQWEYFDGIIHDTSDHGWLNLGGVIQVSSNICAAKIGLTIPKAVFAEYLARLGFGHRIGIFTDNEGKRLAGEAEGYVLPVDKWTPVDHAAIAFGHGILVSPLQMMTAINTLATGGLRVQPRLVREVYDNSGQKTDSAQTLPPLRIFSPETAQKVKGFMMEVVTPKGTGEKAMVEGYSVAGKTGTTELYDIEARGYSKTKHIASFVGFVPAENPELTIMVLVEEPKKGRYGGVVAAPVFREIAQRALPLLGVWPREGVRRVSGAVP